MARRRRGRLTAAAPAVAAALIAVAPPAAARGPVPFALPGEPMALAAGPDGAAVFATRGGSSDVRVIARAGDPLIREPLLARSSPDRSFTDPSLTYERADYLGTYAPVDGADASSVEVVSVPLGGAPAPPVTLSQPGLFAVGGGLVTGPSGAQALTYAEGPDRTHLRQVMRFRPAGSPTWTPPVPLPGADRPDQGLSVRLDEEGGGVLLGRTYNGTASRPFVIRIHADGSLGAPIDLGLAQLDIPAAADIDVQDTFTADGTFHAVLSVPASGSRHEHPDRLVATALRPGQDAAVATVLGGAAPKYGPDAYFSIDALDADGVVIASATRGRGTIRIFTARRGELPVRTATIHATTPQEVSVLRAPDGRLNVVWYANRPNGRGVLMGVHRLPGAERFSRPRPLSRSVFTRGSIVIDSAVGLSDGGVALAYGRYGGSEDRMFGLLARP